jgi:hypothetical protein
LSSYVSSWSPIPIVFPKLLSSARSIEKKVPHCLSSGVLSVFVSDRHARSPLHLLLKLSRALMPSAGFAASPVSVP